MLAVEIVPTMSCGPDTSPPWSTGRTLLLTPKVSQTVTQYPYGYYSAHMDTVTAWRLALAMAVIPYNDDAACDFAGPCIYNEPPRWQRTCAHCDAVTLLCHAHRGHLVEVLIADVIPVCRVCFGPLPTMSGVTLIGANS
jgi:hypothetical protein